MKGNRTIQAAACACAALAAAWHYAYVYTSFEGASVRTNRFTGTSETSTAQGWRPLHEGVIVNRALRGE